MRILLLLIAGTLLATGCGADQGPSTAGGTTSASSEPETPATTTTPAPPTASGVRPPTASLVPPSGPSGDPAAVVPADLLERVLADAASRAGVARAQVRATGASAQTWPNSALGCEEPGMAYLDVLTDGYQILVSAGGQNLDYRASGSTFKVCTRG
ncbi:MAG TPA: hypothetical protein VGD67_28550 [Pseudonocardiaceae bacterium]